MAAFGDKRLKDITKLLADAGAKFPNDPFLLYIQAAPLHWSGDAIQGVALMQKLEQTATEPLLSVGRARELTFLSGNFDNVDRVEQAEKVAKEILTAAQIDPAASLQTVTTMLESVQHRDGGAAWLAQTAAGIQDPVVSAEDSDRCREGIYSRRASGGCTQAGRCLEDRRGWIPKPSLTLQKLVDAAAWTISGIVPSAMLAGVDGWRVTAVGTPSFRNGWHRSFWINRPSSERMGVFPFPLRADLIGLVLSGHGAGGDISWSRNSGRRLSRAISETPTIPRCAAAAPGGSAGHSSRSRMSFR